MKGKTKHQAYKLRYAVDVESSLIVATPMYEATKHDSATLTQTLQDAQINLV